MSRKAERSAAQVDVHREIERVFDIEIETLRSVKAKLSTECEEAVYVLAACSGRVILTGIGKSGIIANKIAATLTSTGTPALFLHASEALHGDLGIVQQGDVVIAVGKSGESSELRVLLPIIKKMGATIISITANPNSKMAANSDIVLTLDIAREACPLNLAPTSSTTAALVLGDAIAVALMKLKRVSTDDFARRHPGGQLGKRLLLTVGDVMRTGERNPLIEVSDSVRNMLIRITAGQAGAISVTNGTGELVGLVSDYDVRKALENQENILGMDIRTIMNPNPSFVYSDQMAVDAVEVMQRRRKPTAVLPVLSREMKVVGMVHLSDLVAVGF